MFRNLAFSLIFFFISSISFADTQYGGYLTQGHYTIDDSEGNTEADLFTNLSFVMTLSGPHRDLRWLVGGGAIFSNQVQAEGSHPGVSTSRLFVEGSFQKRFRWSSAFKPWGGIGLNIGQDEFTSRHTVDQNGFLAQRFDDKQQIKVGLVLNLNQEFPLGEKAHWGYKFEYLSVSKSFSGFSAGVTFFY